MHDALSSEDYKFIAEKLSFDFFNAGETVFKAREVGEVFYIILQGTISVLVPNFKSTNSQKEENVSVREH